MHVCEKIRVAAKNGYTLSVWGQKKVYQNQVKRHLTSPAIGLKRIVLVFAGESAGAPELSTLLDFQNFFLFLANQRSSIVSPYAPYTNADVRRDPSTPHISHNVTPTTHVSACLTAVARSSCIVG